MKNIENSDFNKIPQGRKEILGVIQNHWANLQWCEASDFERGVTYILDSQNPRPANAKKAKEEVQIQQFKDGGTTINVTDECFKELQEIIQEFWIDTEKIGELLQKKFSWKLSSYASVRLFIFNNEKLQPPDSQVRKLEKSEKPLFDAFMEKCSEAEREEVYMDFGASFHNFYAYFVSGEIVALGEFCKIHDEDIIVIPSIITRADSRGKWYGKAVVNVMTHKMLEQGFIPQYRCDPGNTGSRNLAKSLGYEEIMYGYSIKTVV